MSKVAGIDGCRGGWIVVYQEDDFELKWCFCKNITEIISKTENCGFDAVAIDIPIGLPTKGHRNVDEEARKTLKRRASCVFYVPIRDLVVMKNGIPFDYTSAKDYREVCCASEKLTGKRISKQVFCIFNKLYDVENNISDLQKKKIREFHPELFWRTEIASKKSKNGQEERIKILENSYKYNEIRDFICKVRKGMCSSIAIDDVIDALCGVLVARKISNNTASCLKESDENLSSVIYY